MKQTSILTQFKPQSVKKLPQSSKLDSNKKNLKEEIDVLNKKTPEQFVEVLIPSKTETLNQISPQKPQRTSNRRSRETFQGIPANIQKKIKFEGQGIDEEYEQIKINLDAKEAKNQNQIEPSNNTLKDSIKLNESNQPSAKELVKSETSQATKEENNQSDSQITNETSFQLKKSFQSGKLLFGDASSDSTTTESANMNMIKKNEANSTLLSNFKKPAISKQTADIINAIRNKQELQKKQSEERKLEDIKKPLETPPALSEETTNLIEQLKQSPGRAKFSPSEYLSRKSPQQSPFKGQLVMVVDSPLKIPGGLVSPQKAFYVMSPSKVAEIMKSPSMADKYGDLLKDEREFLLPTEYKKLSKIFEHLDSSVNYHITRETPTFFSNLSQALENLLQMRISPRHLAQILHVMPEAYKVTWEKNEKSQHDYSLYISFPNDENQLESDAKKVMTRYKLEERKATFKANLIEITKSHHKKFLETVPLDEKKINYEEQKCWNSKFDVHGCPAIPEAKLPNKPHHDNLISVHDFLKTNEIQNQRTKAALEEMIKKQEEKPVVQAPQNRPVKSIAGISEKLLEKIRQKEQLLKEQEAARKKSLEKNYIEMKKDELKRIAEIIKIYYTQRGVANMFYASVIDHVADNKHSMILGKVEVASYIDILIQILPFWITVSVNNGNKILKMDKTVNMTLVNSTIVSASLPQK